MRRVWMQAGMKVGVKRVAIIAFAGYLAWNIAWLSRGRVPPSLLKYCTGLPCPTTGSCRSLLAFFHGDYCGAVLFNPFTSLYIGLTCLSGVVVLKCLLRKRELALPPFLVRAWCFALCFGWAAKLALGREYW